MLITSFTNLLCAVLHVLQAKWGRPGHSTYIMYFYYICHALSVITVYNEMLPESLRPKKSAMEFQNLLNYIITMVFPCHNYLTSFLALTPLYLLTVYC